MKKRIGMRIFMAAVAIMMAFGAQANEIPQVLDGYKKWVFRLRYPSGYNNFGAPTTAGFRIAETAGDSIVGNYTMKKIRVEDIPLFEDKHTVNYYAVYEKDGVISRPYVNGNKIELVPIIDFNATEGDIMERKIGVKSWELRIDKEGYIETGYDFRVHSYRNVRVLTVMRANNSDESQQVADGLIKRACHWIEGVGFTNNYYMFNDRMPSFSYDRNSKSYELLECYRGVKKNPTGAKQMHLIYRSENLNNYVSHYYKSGEDCLRSFEPGKSWVTVCYVSGYLDCGHTDSKFEKAYDVRHTFAGDTIVDGQKMHKLVTSLEFNYGPYNDCEESGAVSYVGFEKNGIVYQKPDGQAIEQMMDFGLHKGDSFTRFAFSEQTYRVVSDEVVNVRGYDRRILTIDGGPETNKGYWVEGVYSTWEATTSGIGGVHRKYAFKACYLNDELIFSAEDLEEFKKSQQSGIEEILPAEGETGDEANPDAHDPAAPVYDLQGHRVTRQVPGQVYISQGRKWIK